MKIAVIFMAILMAVLMPVVAAAGDLTPPKFTPPKGCTAFLTVQSKSCTVSHHYRCAAAPEGEHWTLNVNEDGPYLLQHLDAEFRWLNDIGLRAGGRDGYETRLITPEMDGNSLTELLQTWEDTYDFTQSVKFSGVEPFVQRIVGVDRLDGTKVTIDGEVLLVTQYESIMEPYAGGRLRTSGNQYVSERFGLFFSGHETEVLDGVRSDFDGSPVRFYESGEAGFLSNIPQFGCGQMMSLNGSEAARG